MTENKKAVIDIYPDNIEIEIDELPGAVFTFEHPDNLWLDDFITSQSDNGSKGPKLLIRGALLKIEGLEDRDGNPVKSEDFNKIPTKYGTLISNAFLEKALAAQGIDVDKFFGREKDAKEGKKSKRTGANS